MGTEKKKWRHPEIGRDEDMTSEQHARTVREQEYIEKRVGTRYGLLPCLALAMATN